MPTTTPSINSNVFSNNGAGGSFQAIPKFSSLLSTMKGSPTLVNDLNTFAAQGGIIVLGANRGGTDATNVGGKVITLDPVLFNDPGNLAAPTVPQIATVIGHELGHELRPGGIVNIGTAKSPEEAAILGNNQEGVAVTEEYTVAKELKTSMFGDDSKVQSQFDQLNSNPIYASNPVALNNAEIALGASYYAKETPSIAPKLNYTQYYSDVWIVIKCDGGTSNATNVDWLHTQQSDIQYTPHADGTCTVDGTKIKLLNSNQTEDIDGTLSKAGSPLTITKTIDDQNGNIEATEKLSTLPDGDISAIVSGIGDIINLDKITLTFAPNTSATLDGSNDILSATNGNIILGSGYINDVINGSGNKFSLGVNDSLTANGANNIFTGSTDKLILGAGSTGDKLTGTSNTVNVANGDSLTLTGSRNFLTGSNDIFSFSANDTGNTVKGNSNTISAGSANSFNVYGSSNKVAATGDYINLGSNSLNNILTGSSNTVNVANGDYLSLTGSNDVFAGSDFTLNLSIGDFENAINGSNNIIHSTSAGGLSANDFTINGSNDQITGAYNRINLGSGSFNDMIKGDENVIKVANGDSFNVVGSFNYVYSVNDYVGVNSGPNNFGENSFTYDNTDVNHFSIAANGDITDLLTTNSGNGQTEYFNFHDGNLNATINGNHVNDDFAGTSLSVDNVGNAIFNTNLGSDTASLTVAADGSGEVFKLGTDSLNFGKNSLVSVSSNDDGIENFNLASNAANYKQTIVWDTNGDTASIQVKGMDNKTFAVSLGDVDDGDTLKINGNNIANYNASGQELESSKLYSDGSQTDTAYDLAGSYNWLNLSDNYTAGGIETSRLENLDNNSSINTTYDISGGNWTTKNSFYTGLNDTGSLSSITTDFKNGTSQVYSNDLSGGAWTNQLVNFSGLDGTGNKTSYTDNLNNGTSQKVQLDPNNVATWSSETYTYTGSNQTGLLSSTALNLDNGTSQIDYNDLSGGLWKDDKYNFTGINGTGSISSIIQNENNGTSLNTIYDLGNNPWSSKITGYSGANDTGNIGSYVENFDNNTSQVQVFNLATGISSEFEDFSGSNATGNMDDIIKNFTSGDSQETKFTDLPSGVTKETFSYADYDANGKLREETTDYANGTSKAILFNPNPLVVSEYANYSGVDDSGILSSGTIDLANGQIITIKNLENKGYKETVDGAGFAVFDITNGKYIDGNGLSPSYGIYGFALGHEVTNAGIPDQAGNLSGGYFNIGGGLDDNTSSSNDSDNVGNYGGSDGFSDIGGIDIGGIDIGDIGDIDGYDNIDFNFDLDFGFAGDKSVVTAELNKDKGIVAQYDIAKGDYTGAKVAEAALKQTNLVSKSSSTASVLEAAKWGKQAITWSISDNDKSTLGSTYLNAVQKAFSSWAAATGLKFTQAIDSAQSDIRIGWSKFDSAHTGVIGYTSFDDKAGNMQHAVIQLESPNQDALTASGADYIYAGTSATLTQSITHEIGHALGFGDNNDLHSIMSYYLSDSNRVMDSNDTNAAKTLYATSYNQLVQAMSSFNGSAGSAIATNASHSANVENNVMVVAAHTQH